MRKVSNIALIRRALNPPGRRLVFGTALVSALCPLFIGLIAVNTTRLEPATPTATNPLPDTSATPAQWLESNTPRLEPATHTPTTLPSPTQTLPIPPAPEVTEQALMPLIVKPEFGCLPQDTPRQVAAVTNVVDGDTIEVEINGESVQVRYIGIDTPERFDPGGEVAKEANSMLVAGKSVILIRDVSETDRYNRLLRYVVVDDLFVNYALVAQGYARTATYPPDIACAEMFLAAEQLARTSHSGFWGEPTSTISAETTSGPGFELLNLTESVRVGDYARATIYTEAGADCSLSYVTPAGTPSQARGLGKKSADQQGVCQWSWKIGSSTRPGIGQVTIQAGGQIEEFRINILP